MPTASELALTEKLDGLDRLSLELLGVLALANDWQRRGDWIKRAKASNVRGPGNEKLDRAKELVRAAIDRLVEEEIVRLGRSGRASRSGRVAPNNILYRTSREVTIAVLKRLHGSGRLAALDKRKSPGWGVHPYDRRFWPTPEELETDLRIATLEAKPKAVARVVAMAKRCLHDKDQEKWLTLSLGPCPSAGALDCFEARERLLYLRSTVDFARTMLDPVAAHVIDAALELDDKKLRLDVGRLLILRGETERALAIDGLPKYGREGLELLAAFWAGDYAEAARIGAEAVASMKTRKRKALYELEGLCHVLAAIACSDGDAKLLEAIAPVSATCSDHDLGEHLPHQVIEAVLHGLQGKRRDLIPGASTRMSEHAEWSAPWVRALHDLWLDVRFPADGDEADVLQRQQAVETLREWAQLARARGFGPIAREFEALAMAYVGEADPAATPTLATALRPPEAWEAVLAGLESIVDRAQSVSDAPEAQQSRELLWQLRISTHTLSATPRVRSTRSKTKTKGREIKLDTLLQADDIRLTPADHDLLNDLVHSPPSWQLGPVERSQLLGRMLERLIGHPRVIDSKGAPIRVEHSPPKLRTTQSGDRLRVEVDPPELVHRPLMWRESKDDEGATLTFTSRTPALEEALDVLGSGVTLPATSKDRLARSLARLSVTVGAEVEGDLKPETEEITADPRPVLLLSWDGDHLSAAARVAPLGIEGPHFPPGVGNTAVSSEVTASDQTRVLRCERDLVDERRRAHQLERDAPTLAAYATGPLSWSVTSLVDALEVVIELGHLGDAVVLAWPEGKPLRPPIERGLGDLRLAVRTTKSWLELDAQIAVDEGQVLGFAELIGRREGARFVALGEGRFLALSEQLRRRIDALHKLGAPKAGRVRASAAMLPVVDGLSESLAEVSFDAKSRARLERAHELADTRPRRPRGFGAQLRDYQREGYEWMWRLAEAGLGACLADDMGLGKTVQALVLLAQRASKGPALVVCPTSVVHNWIAETQRFAPSLRPAVLADAPDRGALLTAARSRDLIVCSYGLLVSEAEALAELTFATVVFDEAHALKNERTKRAKAARELDASFRLGLTGTPVENRPAELWGLFRVLLPGLLGTRKQFDERFAKPIARGEREAASQLRALLKHFILRRTKAQVLDELPPRTEVTLEIEPTAKASAYYEALRRRALESVEGGDQRTQRVRILAELTRLRQAAVDPRLLDEDGPAGAKVDALTQQLLSLREEGHRALVFTQFLGAMALMRQAFEAAGIEYLELDGATPAAERARRVDAFQAGEGDVFMLSLRAGGVGMNLTGADYVLHLDPWWNPAVEDQATDRAHRLGQSRPVTVYRLVSKGTIEEKILALHAEKRELTDDLLFGLEGAGALDLDDLIGLLAD